MSRSRVRGAGKVARRLAFRLRTGTRVREYADRRRQRLIRPALLVIVLVHDENAGDLFSSRVPRYHRMRFPEHPTYITRVARVITRAFRESEPIRVSARCFLLPIAEPFSPSLRGERHGGEGGILSLD